MTPLAPVFLLVLVTETMLVAAKRTHGGFDRIVDKVFHRLAAANECPDGLQIIVRHVAKTFPLHDRIPVPCANLPGADGLDKDCFIVVRDAARTGRQVQRVDGLATADRKER